MNIHQINGSTAVTNAYSPTAKASTGTDDTTNVTTVAAPTPASGPAPTPLVETFVSRPADFIRKLQELTQSDPAKAKQFLDQISKKLAADAKAAGTGDKGEALQKLAGHFADASNTGDFSQLQLQEQHGKVHRAYAAQQEPAALLDLLDKKINEVQAAKMPVPKASAA